MADRYFTETPIQDRRAVLSGPEAHHLIHVIRAKPGMEVTLFDGSGAEFPARVERIGRSEVELAVLERREVDRELHRQIVLATALPKGDRQRWLIEKAVELGISRIVPLQTERSVALPVPRAMDRLRRTVIEASKQCGRNRLMEIAQPQKWFDFVEQTREVPAFRMVAHPHGTDQELGEPGPSVPVFLAVGPEGGFTDEEVSRAVAAGWQLVDLGPRILRVETAAVVLAAKVPD